jgi:hypothetical protein
MSLVTLNSSEFSSGLLQPKWAFDPVPVRHLNATIIHSKS